MSHITVQLGPCCTVPFDALGPDEAGEGREPPVRGRHLCSEAGLSDCMQRHLRRKQRRHWVRTPRTTVQ